MARYNRLANIRLYDVCASLTAEDLRLDRKVYFSSIFRTLNHLWTGDHIWMTRFEGGSVPSIDLGALVYDDFDALQDARQKMDTRIENFFDTVSPDFFDGAIVYINNSNVECSDAVAKIIPHFFNHQTHHRGQVHAMLTQTGAEAPVLDLHRVLDGAMAGF